MAQVGGRAALPYVAAFDGLRALAVVAVVAYHASLPEVPGGFFGVDVFFVISGYLVTALFLARARQATPSGAPIPDRAGLIDFWRRRLTRLVPAALAVVLLTGMVFAMLDVRSPVTLAIEAIAALGYGANWFFLFSDQSYFETIAMPSPFLHFWSLAVEAQFYLLWPVLLIAALRFGGRLAAFAMAVSLAAISTLVVAGLYSPTSDPSRAYYGTDARVAGLLLGAALAIVVTPQRAARLRRWPLEVSGWGGLAVLIALITTVSEFDPFIYHGGFFVASTAALVVLLAALHGRNSVALVLSQAPLRWLGERAYSIYLWHWPVFVLSQPQTAAELNSISLLVARLGVTLVLADASYRLVESRFRSSSHVQSSSHASVDRGTGPLLQRPWARPAGVFALGLIAVVAAGGLPMRVGLATETANLASAYAGQAIAGGEDVRSVALPGAGAVAGDLVRSFANGNYAAAVAESVVDDLAPQQARLATTLLTVSGFPALARQIESASTSPASVLSTSPLTPFADDDALTGIPGRTGTEAAPVRGTTAAPSSPSRGSAAPDIVEDEEVSSSVASSGGVAPVDGPLTEVTPTAAPDPTVIGASVTVIGDSVALGAASALLSAMPGAVVDAEVGRQFWTTPQVIERLAASGALGDIVVLHLGANGPFSGEQFEAIMSLLEGHTVIFVNITVPRRWESDVNQGLVAQVSGREGVSLADWNSVSRDETGYFIADGVHLTAAGQSAYASFIARAVAAAIASTE